MTSTVADLRWWQSSALRFTAVAGFAFIAGFGLGSRDKPGDFASRPSDRASLHFPLWIENALGGCTAGLREIVRRFVTARRQIPLLGLGNGGSTEAERIVGVEHRKPPFPPELVQLLRSTCLCYLSMSAEGTAVDGRRLSSPQLCLMNYTYDENEEILIMSSRRDTQKLRNLQRNSSVSILVHDFPHERSISESTLGTLESGHSSVTTNYPAAGQLDAMAAGSLSEGSSPGGSHGYTRTCSVTLYGTVRILDREDREQEKAEKERYRAIHLARNPQYANFIEGENIAVLVVAVKSAQICNVKDQVKTWRCDARE
ncbi:unnamed protein product [Amoebophrya sp. A25]|nr:unnamed protein product [Amoebophrya sp. A25]|eukprot:GSA25T00005233001.1